MERKLKNVQALPSSEAQSLLGIDAVPDEN
jgi:DNA recombination protein RmuC